MVDTPVSAESTPKTPIQVIVAIASTLIAVAVGALYLLATYNSPECVIEGQCELPNGDSVRVSVDQTEQGWVEEDGLCRVTVKGIRKHRLRVTARNHAYAIRDVFTLPFPKTSAFAIIRASEFKFPRGTSGTKGTPDSRLPKLARASQASMRTKPAEVVLPNDKLLMNEAFETPNSPPTPPWIVWKTDGRFERAVDEPWRHRSGHMLRFIKDCTLKLLVSSLVPLDSIRGDTLIASAWVRTENLQEREDGSGWEGGKFHIAWMTRSRGEIMNHWGEGSDGFVSTEDNAAWVRMVRRCYVPTDAESVNIFIGNQRGLGEVWFDDLQLRVRRTRRAASR